MTSQDLLDLYDIKRFLQMRKLLDEPKDNEGTEETIGFLISAFIDRAEEETQGFIITSFIDKAKEEKS